MRYTTGFALLKLSVDRNLELGKTEFFFQKNEQLFLRIYTALSIWVVGSKIQARATRPKGSVGGSRRLLYTR